MAIRNFPKKLANGKYRFTCTETTKFPSGKGYVNRIVLYNEVLTPKINSYQITPLKDFFKEYLVVDIDFKNGL